jgi:hypothetical protein
MSDLHIYQLNYTVLNTLGLERSYGTKTLSTQIARVPCTYVVENKDVPDRNICVPPVRKYANYRTLPLNYLSTEYELKMLYKHAKLKEIILLIVL